MLTNMEQIQLCYEIALSIGTSLDLKQMLQTSLLIILKRLNCSIGVILQTNNDLELGYTKIYSIPRNIDKNQSYLDALKCLPKKGSELMVYSCDDNFPISGQDKLGANYLIFKLKEFGCLILIKNRGSLAVPIIKSLIPLVRKLANACLACNQNDALQENEKKYRSLVENINIGIYRTSSDLHGNFIQVNPAMAKMFGFDNPKELMKYPVSVLYHNLQEREKFMQEVIEEGVIRQKLLRLRKKDGTSIWTSSAVTPKYDEAGNIKWFDGVIEDISDRKKAIEAMQVELLERAKVEKKLQEAIKMKSTFFSTVSHELRTPLTAIKEGISIVLDGSAGVINHVQSNFLTLSKRNLDRLHRLINDVLDLSKIESGKITYNIVKVDIREIISDVVAIHESIIKERNLYLRAEISKNLGKIDCDFDKMAQVLTNLINNALKFTNRGGITITIRKDNRQRLVAFSVKDTGIGIKKQDIPRLFHTFQQVGKDQYRKPGGTGLGLVICKEIIEKHGGKIWVESTYRKGSEFIFTLPQKDRS
ncbi:ATP-binding protein [Candidatus Margulisiibacteriota bacterium]